jgi:hypothetical protein
MREHGSRNNDQKETLEVMVNRVSKSGLISETACAQTEDAIQMDSWIFGGRKVK